jgi:LCP family protein required for cell wall assembly
VTPISYSNRRTGLDYLIYAMALAIVAVGVFGVYDTIVFSARGDQTPGESGLMRFVAPEFAPGLNRVNVLLMGCDDRPKEGGRADTIILLMVDKANRQASVLSFPRDLHVDIPGHGKDKINAAYSYYLDKGDHEGEKKTVETVEGITGLTIPYYIKVNMQGLPKIVDTLGGVDIYVEKDMNWECPGDIVCYLKKGQQHLNGEKFLSYVRHRKDFIFKNQSTDFERMERAQKALRELAKQHLRPQSIRKIPAIVDQVVRNVSTNMAIDDLVGLACFMRTVDPDDIATAGVPVRDAMINGVYFAEYDPAAMAEVLDELQRHLDGLPPKPCPVEVLNGSGRPGAAAAVSRMLEDRGYEVTRATNAESFDHAQTLIEYKQGKKETGKQVQAVLGVGTLRPLELDTRLEERACVRITVGADFVPPNSALTEAGADVDAD